MEGGRKEGGRGEEVRKGRETESQKGSGVILTYSSSKVLYRSSCGCLQLDHINIAIQRLHMCVCVWWEGAWIAEVNSQAM